MSNIEHLLPDGLCHWGSHVYEARPRAIARVFATAGGHTYTIPACEGCVSRARKNGYDPIMPLSPVKEDVAAGCEIRWGYHNEHGCREGSNHPPLMEGIDGSERYHHCDCGSLHITHDYDPEKHKSKVYA